MSRIERGAKAGCETIVNGDPALKYRATKNNVPLGLRPDSSRYTGYFSDQAQPWKGFVVLARPFKAGNGSATTILHSAVILRFNPGKWQRDNDPVTQPSGRQRCV